VTVCKLAQNKYCEVADDDENSEYDSHRGSQVETGDERCQK